MACSQEEMLDFLQAYRSRNNLTIIKFLQQKKIIHPNRECKCGLNLKIVPRSDVPDKYAWRCSTCGARVSLRRGTFLESFKISLQAIMDIIFHWALQTRQTDQEDFTDCHRQTILTFQQKLRLIACKAIKIDNFKLGGIGNNWI
jgi:hypothetical protein